jgi:ATP-dependent DNA helicase RecG
LVIEKFRKGDLDILVSTPVVEVGIDIPQATIMLIEGADRFGLAQLHQLRGRVGRGQKESYCLLFTQLTEGKSIQRLKMMETTYVGMKLAELDLKMRGPGEVFGTAQHGFPDLKIASYSDTNLIQTTHEIAAFLNEHLNQYPLLKKKLQQISKPKIEPN